MPTKYGQNYQRSKTASTARLLKLNQGNPYIYIHTHTQSKNFVLLNIKPQEISIN